MMHSRIRTMWRPLLLAPILLLLMASRIEPLVDPPPVPLPAGISQDAVVHAINESVRQCISGPHELAGQSPSAVHSIDVSVWQTFSGMV